MTPKKIKIEKSKTEGNVLLKAISQVRTDIIKDIAPMFEAVHGKFLNMDKKFEVVDQRLSVISSDIHEMKQGISTAMEIPDMSLRHEVAIKEINERITIVEQDLTVVKTAIRTSNKN